MMTLKFKRDNHFRAQLFDQASFKHQGKANLNLLLALLQHLPAGQIILDPMAGTGSALIYLDYGYPVICGELEAHWSQLCEINRKSITISRLFAASTPALCNQWDAARLPLQNESVADIVTSPPYWDMLSDWHIHSHNLQADGHEIYGICYGLHPGNIGNIHIYEDYLRAMFAVYAECYRVLRPGGIMALILKDRIHKQRLIPITADTITLAAALGFRLLDTIERQVTPSFHRNVLQQNFPSGPTVDHESVLIFRKPKVVATPENQFRRSAKIALVQAPKPDSNPSWQLYQKALSYCSLTTKNHLIYVLTESGVKRHYRFIEKDHHSPALSHFRQRREYAFNIMADIVTKYHFTTGTEIEFHGSMDYGKYVTRRAVTLGMSITNPTEGLNLGQKLKWYTDNLREVK